METYVVPRDRSRLQSCGLYWISDTSDPRKEQCSVLDPGCLAVGRLASASAAVVDPILAILRGRGQVVDHVPGVPDLVGVIITANPGLNLPATKNESKTNLGRKKRSHTRLPSAWLPPVRSRHLFFQARRLSNCSENRKGTRNKVNNEDKK